MTVSEWENATAAVRSNCSSRYLIKWNKLTTYRMNQGASDHVGKDNNFMVDTLTTIMAGQYPVLGSELGLIFCCEIHS